MKFLNLSYLKNKDFRTFLQEKKLSYSTFLFILLGSWSISFGTALYLDLLHFQSWQSTGSFFIFWLIVLAISFWLSQKTLYQRGVWYLNHSFLLASTFLMIFSQPDAWFLVFFEYILLLFLILSWGSACFFSLTDLFFPGIVAILGLALFFIQNFSQFLHDSSSLLSFLFSLILVMAITLASVWNTFRVIKSLENVYREKQNLEEVAQILRIRIRAKTKELRQQAENLKKESALRTQALRERIQELERFRKVTIDRELRMVELKKEMKQLRQELQKLKHGKKN